MQSLKSKVLNATIWSSSLALTTQAINFLTLVFLARMLSPEAFGLVAIAYVFVAFAQVITDLGTTSAVIHGQNIQEKTLASCFWLNITLGLLFFATMFLSAERIAAFYGDESLTEICQALSLIFITTSLSLQPKALLLKQMLHRKVSQIEMLTSITSSFLAIILAITYANYWCLVVQLVAKSFFDCILLIKASSFRIKGNFSPRACRDSLQYGSAVFATQLLRQTTLQTDKLLIGKFLDPHIAGLYSRAFQLMLFPVQNTSRTVANVLFPALSSIQNDRDRVFKIYKKATMSTALVTCPMMCGLIVIAPETVLLLFGEQWIEMTPFLRFFCAIGIVMSTATITGSVYLALGKPKTQLKVNLVNQPLQIAACVVGIQHGIYGMMLGYIAAYLSSALITWSVVNNLLRQPIKSFLFEIIRTYRISAYMIALIWPMKLQLLEYDLDPITTMIITICSGTFIYGLLVYSLKPPHSEELIRLLIGRQKTTQPRFWRD